MNLQNLPVFRSKIIISTLLSGAMAWTLSGCAEREEATDDPSKKPDPTRFTYEVVADGLEEPMQLEFDHEGRVYWIERTGAVKRADEASGQVTRLGKVALTTEKAPGLIGMLLAKDFQRSQQVFLYYSAAEDKGEYMRLSRFTLEANGQMNMDSEVVLLKIFWEQPDGEHFGGGMVWDNEGNLLLSVGCDSSPTQYAPFAFSNEGGRGEDSGRSAGNSNDLRGAILRIRPHPDGTYSIPENNLFPEGIPQTRPEIYIMGNRNPWRLSIDSQTGYLHWGEVGPDAGIDSEKYGPKGYDEFNVAKGAGNFGWPFFIANNLPYNRYNYETGEYGEPFDPMAPVNNSPNNTGLEKLPPAQPSLVAYPYRVSDEWPLLGSAARSAVGGPVFRKSNFSSNALRLFPSYYEGKWLVTDYVRNWIMVISMDGERTEATSIEPFLPPGHLKHKQPLDMDFGPTGDLYLVEYGLAGQGRVSKMVYNAGNRPPIANASAEPSAGAVPLEVNLSSDGTVDFDGDQLNYTWRFRPLGDGEELVYDGPHPRASIQQAGKYEVTLTVSDPEGAADSTLLEIVAGNEKPEVKFKITSGNRTFFFPNENIGYRVEVRDEEDGTTEKGDIAPESVSVTAEYIPSGLSPEELIRLKKEGAVQPGEALRHIQAQSLLEQYNCMTCHQLDEKLLGPSFREIALKYGQNSNAFDIMHRSIFEGSSGKWGEINMPPHPMLSGEETSRIIDYILSQADGESGVRKLPLEGNFSMHAFEPRSHVSRLGKFYSFNFEPGSYLFHASYTDRGSDEVPGINLTGDHLVLLRYPLLTPESADYFSEEGVSFTPSTDDPGFIITGKGGYLGFRNIDLTGINKINIGALTRFWHWSHFIGGIVELRVGSPTGTVIGEPFEIIPHPIKEGEGPFFGEDAGKPVPFDVSKVDGIHDVYIIVRNEGAKESDALVIMTGIEFIK
ncbi:PQQ-dependent sugar dehydrogenase [Negadavirga shengliensis]|uniref:PQQ-dependent sugar dehydrogenase n=1 Tax=Negadavirga shengliensis TaxID=1389218 RepID=A0ABV9T0A0_9BACT